MQLLLYAYASAGYDVNGHARNSRSLNTPSKARFHRCLGALKTLYIKMNLQKPINVTRSHFKTLYKGLDLR
jgi:hypothetical protein